MARIGDSPSWSGCGSEDLRHRQARRMTPADPFALATLVAGVLEKIGLRYVIGGSVAASIYGEPRSTLDLDVMIVADTESVRRLVQQLDSDSTSRKRTR